jgi:phosphoglycolate phosphatase
MISNVLFDLDGTLTDPKEGITRCIQFAIDKLGREVPQADDLLWCIGPPLRDSFARLLGSTDNALLDLALQHYRKRFTEIGIYENSIYPGIILALQNIRAFFHGIFGSEIDGRLSDKGDLVAHILKYCALDPRFSLIVGDRSHDVVGGKRNGIKTATVTYGYGTRCEIDAAEPDFVFDSPSELAVFLQKNRPPNLPLNSDG